MIGRSSYYALLVLAGLAGGAGDILLARWAKTPRPFWIITGFISWFVCLSLFAALMRYGGRSLGVTFTLSAVTQCVVVLGWDLCTNDLRTSARLWVGIVLAIAGLMLMEWGDN